MKLYAIVAAAIIAVVAFHFIKQWAYREGRAAAYQIRMSECRERYPRYRCEVQLARDFPEVR